MEGYRELISVLPLDTVDFAFAYGSGAVQQSSENKEEKMVDFVIVTDDPVKFHTANIAANASHYSLLRMVGPTTISTFQCNSGARVFYNTHVNVGKRKIKYGVISVENFKEDLLDWRWIYIAGRLHKPVLEVIKPSQTIEELIVENRRSALQTALLLLPEKFTLRELFQKIAGISYTGDFRMIIGEDKNKVSKIVDGGFESFLDVYRPLIADDERVVLKSDEKGVQDGSTPAIYHRLNLLPSEVLNGLQKTWNRKVNRQQDTEEVIFSLAHRHDIAPTLERVIGNIIRPVAVTQTAKNAVSAGVTRSFIYSMAKMTKMLKK